MKSATTQTRVVGTGAWLPWETVLQIVRLRLRPASAWQVFSVILFTSARYGGKPAQLSHQDIARLTGLSVRSVQRAMKMLIAKGFVERDGRYGRLNIGSAIAIRPKTAAPPNGELGADNKLAARSGKSGAANKLSDRTGQQAGRSPTVSIVPGSSKPDIGTGRAFSPKQLAVLTDVFNEATELTGSDARNLPLTDYWAKRLKLPLGSTYGDAIERVERSGDRMLAGQVVRATLALREDERVQGIDLDAPGIKNESQTCIGQIQPKEQDVEHQHK